MKQLRKFFLSTFLSATVIVGMISVAQANGGGAPPGCPSHMSENYSDAIAPQTPWAFYDINVTTPETMRNFFWVIDSTYDLMIAKGVRPNKIKFVVSLRGLSVSFVTDDFLANNPVGQEIKVYLDSLLAKGVRVEACQISCDWVGTDPDTLQDGVLVIDNAFASSIFYQRKGYALVTVTDLP